MSNGIIFNIQKFCIHDGDGIRTCVFLKGCPLRCIWCHNPESLEKSPELSFDNSKCTECGKCAECDARKIENGYLIIDRKKCTQCGKCAEICLNCANEIIGREMSTEEVMTEVMKDKIFYEQSGGGLTLTGGEPSYQSEFALELLTLAKESGISSAVETCGIGARDFYVKAADLSTTFLFDVKCIDSERHKALTGADNTRIMANLEYLMSRNADVIIRLPLIPSCNDTDSDLALLSDFLHKNKGRYRYAEIMPYHSLGVAKRDRLGKNASFTHENATENEISRWLKTLNSQSADVRISK